ERHMRRPLGCVARPWVDAFGSDLTRRSPHLTRTGDIMRVEPLAVLLAAAAVLGGCGNVTPDPASPPSPPSGIDGRWGDLLLATGSSLAAGDRHVCALLEGGAVKCWGRNLEGQLGLGNSGFYSLVGDNPGEMGNALGYVALGRPAIAI